MKAGKAPSGRYTTVEVIVRLQNGLSRIYTWTSPLGLSAVLHKGPGWAKQELKKAKVPGRSTIVGMNVEAQYHVGRFRR